MDVAQHCGVSRATVSLVLNDSPLVAAKTRDRVRQAMTELGYVYNRAAASLRTQHSDAIGVVLTNITNPYFAEFATGVQDVLTSSAAVPLLAVSGEDRELQHRLVKSLVERNVDGIVLIPAHGTTPNDLPDLLGTPLVLMARRLNGMDVDYVGAQNRDGGYAAAEHLYSHGCRRIAFVGGYADSSARDERAAGVEEFLNEHGLTLNSDHSLVCEPARPQAREAVMWLLTEDPEVDGIVCFSDVVAFGVLDAIADMGRSIGSDVRVIGFDDVHAAGLNRPSLSSVAVPARDTGRRAAQLVLERAAGSTESTVREEFPVKLEPRETCGCPRPQLLY
ncbi:MAG TPA: LacI family DNA-binding transcriptional regulator [Propionibacteriaceae bacterium]|nr:LacI family DNA-binding transcriptional regulator [Propionibacteriaceae bacterium]